jgi:hypothetical protein
MKRMASYEEDARVIPNFASNIGFDAAGMEDLS